MRFLDQTYLKYKNASQMFIFIYRAQLTKLKKLDHEFLFYFLQN